MDDPVSPQILQPKTPRKWYKKKRYLIPLGVATLMLMSALGGGNSPGPASQNKVQSAVEQQSGLSAQQTNGVPAGTVTPSEHRERTQSAKSASTPTSVAVPSASDNSTITTSGNSTSTSVNTSVNTDPGDGSGSSSSISVVQSGGDSASSVISQTQSSHSSTTQSETLSNNNSYTNVDGNTVHSPAYSATVPAGATARCGDGTYSFSQHHSGTCSHHGGVSAWLD